MAFTVFESINMQSTAHGGRIYDCVAEEAIENGTVGYIEELADGESHIYKFVKGAKDKCDPLVVDQPAWTEDTSKITNQRRDNFVNKPGVPFRARRLATHDVFGVTIDGFTPASQTEVKVGAYVTIDTTTGKFVAQKTAPESGSYGKIERERIAGGTLATTAHNYGHAMKIFEIRIVH